MYQFRFGLIRRIVLLEPGLDSGQLIPVQTVVIGTKRNQANKEEKGPARSKERERERERERVSRHGGSYVYPSAHLYGFTMHWRVIGHRKASGIFLSTFPVLDGPPLRPPPPRELLILAFAPLDDDEGELLVREDDDDEA